MRNFKHGTNSRILPCSEVNQDWNSSVQHPAGSATEPSATSTSKPGAANPLLQPATLQVQQEIPARAQQSQEALNPLHIPSLDVWNISQCHHRHLGDTEQVIPGGISAVHTGRMIPGFLEGGAGWEVSKEGFLSFIVPGKWLQPETSTLWKSEQVPVAL